MIGSADATLLAVLAMVDIVIIEAALRAGDATAAVTHGENDAIGTRAPNVAALTAKRRRGETLRRLRSLSSTAVSRPESCDGRAELNFLIVRMLLTLLARAVLRNLVAACGLSCDNET